MWSRRTIAWSAIAACFALALPARAADPTGIWSTEDSKARVRIYACGQALCATIVSLKEPNDPQSGKPKLDKFNRDASKHARPVVGIELMAGMKASAPDQWEGSLYNPEDGNTYKGILTALGLLTLKLQGCVLGGLICKSEIWKRAN